MVLSEKLKTDLDKLSPASQAELMMLTGILAIHDSKAPRGVKADAAEALVSLFRVKIVMDLARICLTDKGDLVEPERTANLLSEFYLQGYYRLKSAQQRAGLLIEALDEKTKP